jgi:hypothetical protein
MVILLLVILLLLLLQVLLFLLFLFFLFLILLLLVTTPPPAAPPPLPSPLPLLLLRASFNFSCLLVLCVSWSLILRLHRFSSEASLFTRFHFAERNLACREGCGIYLLNYKPTWSYSRLCYYGLHKSSHARKSKYFQANVSPHF